MQEQPWGFTGVFDKKNGGGFLDEIYPNAYDNSHKREEDEGIQADIVSALKLSGISKASSVVADIMRN